MHFDKKGEVGKAKGSHLLCYIENTTDQGESVNKEKDENQKTFLPKYYYGAVDRVSGHPVAGEE
ncbi:MAG TPA: hypothetical protein HPP90_05515 [Deltaproteobacteria bacterium]|nr:hypothetical protein [Deltaproteobacteria bacterium]